MTDLEQRADTEARHAHRELVEQLEAEKRALALDALSALGQAEEAYEEQKRLEAENARLLEALGRAIVVASVVKAAHVKANGQYFNVEEVISSARAALAGEDT